MDRHSRQADQIGEDLANAADPKGWMKERWDWLSDEEIEPLEGHPERLQEKLRAHYGDGRWKEEYEEFREANPETK